MPTVATNQCFVYFLQRTLFVKASTTGDSLSRFKTLVTELKIPSYDIVISTIEENRIQDIIKIAQDAAKSGSTNRLLIAGGKLEYEVTAIAMNGLAHGFDVYVLGDILEPSTDNYANLYWDRLIHAGVVPTTMVQMVVEWISSESDSKTSSIIRLAAERLMFFVN